MSDDMKQQAAIWLETIPRAVREEAAGLLAVEVGFGAGPGCCAGKIRRFDAPVPLPGALGWLARYAGVLKRAHLQLSDGSILWFIRDGYERWSRGAHPPPRPGLVVGSRDPQ